MIWRADGLGEVLAALAADFGAVTVLPVHPKPDAAAIRVLIRAVKASRAPLALLPGFILADASARPTTEAEKVLREGARAAFSRKLRRAGVQPSGIRRQRLGRLPVVGDGWESRTLRQ